ncbi:MAG: hypothetical protein CMM15_10380 [Rhodospirillaceae bacterium]|nr:hypothetical protein [Rhodospirillaceae bacterium]OUX67973.1 MAG: hypothetical protein CBD38_00715 [bacterium TMED178]
MHSFYIASGYIGSFLISVVLIPQVYITFKTKDVEGLSYTFLLLRCVSAIFFALYATGIVIEENVIDGAPIVIANILIIVSTFILLYAKHKFKKQK